MGEETKPAVSRRRLLRRAGAVAAGVGVVGAASAAPALAADGDAVTVGGTFTGTAKTSLTSGDATTPTFKLSNPNGAGVPLETKPIQMISDFQSPVNPASVPVGSLYIDRFGDVHAVGDGQVDGDPHYDLMLYSPTWATMTIATPPMRVLHTWNGVPGMQDLIVDGTREAGGLNRLLPRAKNAFGFYGHDLVVDLSSFVVGGYAAVQANLTIGDAAGVGYAAMWPTDLSTPAPGHGVDEWPGNSSINYPANAYIANFTQTLLGDSGYISLRLTTTATVILDIVGFVVADPAAQFGPGPGMHAKAFSAVRASGRRVIPRR